MKKRWVVFSVVVLLIVGAGGFWAYTALRGDQKPQQKTTQPSQETHNPTPPPPPRLHM